MKEDRRHPMPTQPPEVRRGNFSEVALGYDAETARSEAQRCLHCKTQPCVAGCPVGVPIPAMLTFVAAGDYENAYRAVSAASSLPAVCGRVCPQERQCEGKCTRGVKGEPVAIGYIERFIADLHAEKKGEELHIPSGSGEKVAVVGSGPAGLSCAGDLARRGYAVTVFEALHEAGGVLTYGIPEFRLPKAVVRREVEGLKALGVEIVTDAVIGRTFTVEELLGQYGFKAVFLGTGAGLPRFMGIKGENAKGVFSANEYLTRANLMRAYEEGSETPIWRAKRAVVVGGGNVAMDAARCARRLGAEVTVVYRRSEAELPARREEIAHAKEEGILFRTLANPAEIVTDGNGAVCAVRCIETELGAPDASGRRTFTEKEGSDFTIGCDCVIMALGTSPNPLVKRTTQGLETGRRGEIVADENGATSLAGVFAGGDAVTGSATVIQAMGAGKTAAAAIDSYLSSLR